MPDKEIDSFWRAIASSVNHLVLCLDGLNKEDLNWRPLDNANSLYVLPNHIMSNMEETILGVLCGQSVKARQREDDFKVKGSSIESTRQKWQELQQRIGSSLAQLPPGALNKEYVHPRRGKITGRDILIVVTKHAAEHVGQADLTRDLLFAARGRPASQRDEYGRIIR
ncbi:MAG: DinB family protein [Chloroflexi bacterium]|nr:DinB family protein [Chloroflexota bacterium]